MPIREIFDEGVTILGDVLTRHGFAFEHLDEGRGSGGHFCAGRYTRGDKSLEFHLRHSLGLVTYRVDADEVSHKAYMKALGVADRAAYPGFSDDPLDGFRHLAHDISHFADDFTTGDGAVIARAALVEREQLADERMRKMAGQVGDQRKLERARQLFKLRDWSAVVELLDSLQYPALMSKSDEQRRDIARRRTRGD